MRVEIRCEQSGFTRHCLCGFDHRSSSFKEVILLAICCGHALMDDASEGITESDERDEEYQSSDGIGEQHSE